MHKTSQGNKNRSVHKRMSSLLYTHTECTIIPIKGGFHVGDRVYAEICNEWINTRGRIDKREGAHTPLSGASPSFRFTLCEMP